MNKNKTPQILAELEALGEGPLNTAVDRAEIDKIRASDREILGKYPADRMAKLISDKAESRNKRKRLSGLFPNVAVAAPAIAVFLILLGAGYYYVNKPRSAAYDIIKGLEPQLAVYLNRSGKVTRLADNSVLKEGDLVQISYTAAGYKYGMIFSLDGAGNVTRHLTDGGEAAELESGGRVALDSAFRLDDAPDFEDFYFVCSQREFGFKQAYNAATGAAENSGLAINRIRLKKERRQP